MEDIVGPSLENIVLYTVSKSFIKWCMEWGILAESKSVKCRTLSYCCPDSYVRKPISQSLPVTNFGQIKSGIFNLLQPGRGI